MHGRSTIVLGIGVLCLSGCGGSEPQPFTAHAVEASAKPPPASPARARGQERATAEVPSAGGTFELGDGARLEIPPDAFADPTTVVFQLGRRTTAFSNNDYQSTVGPVLAVAPAIRAPDGSPLIISVPFTSMPEGFSDDDARIAVEAPDEEQQRAFGENSMVTRWHYRKASVQQGRMRAELDYIPGMRVQFLLSRDEY